MPAPKLASLVVAVLAIPAALALPAPGVLDDAASGQDAGGSPSAAMPLAHGSYHGNLTPDDADWYAFPSGSTLGCLSVSVLSSHALRVRLTAGPGVDILGGLEDGLFGATVAVGPATPQLGIVPDEDPWDAFSVGPYAFDLRLAPSSVVGDTRQDDAPTLLSRARSAPDACFRGVFHGSITDGDVDVWAFTGSAGHVVTYSFASETTLPATLEVLQVDGSPLGAPVASGELAQATLPYDGTYFLRADGIAPSSAENYTVAFVSGPEPTGCRPYCYHMD